MNKKENLVWIDLEMTGLNVETDVILEIATIITDGNLTVLHKGPELVIHCSNDKLENMDPWVKNTHAKSGLTRAVQQSSVTVAQAEQETLAMIREFCEPKMVPLCGNSVWNDRIFLSKYMPQLLNFLHYRLIDVTSVKEIVQRWYPYDPNINFLKKDMHRAMVDIEESIEELRHYRAHFF
ncbi:MAG TPA: oligoribonuclease, partial [Candidatus Babeliales bacterium]|nr:oligoribonuclease [Candidatus Babeliales bacterium]